MRFTKRQRENLARVFFNLGQAIFIALIIGRIATPERISGLGFVLGIIGFVLFLAIGTFLDKGG